MLVQKGYQSGDTVSLKLVNGDEIVAKYIESGVEGFVLERPMTVMPSHQGLGLIQSLISASLNKNVLIRFEHIMIHHETESQVRDHYISVTTGIKPITKGSIIT